LPQLARMLQMNDGQRMAYEQQLAQQAAAPVRVVQIAPLPPPPPAVVEGPPPPPLVTFTPRPRDYGGLRPDDFERLPPPGHGIAVDIALTKDNKFRPRLTQ